MFKGEICNKLHTKGKCLAQVCPVQIMAEKITKIYDSCIMDKPHFQENKLNSGDNSSNTSVIISNRSPDP
jgi:hypothetical protein